MVWEQNHDKKDVFETEKKAERKIAQPDVASWPGGVKGISSELKSWMRKCLPRKTNVTRQWNDGALSQMLTGLIKRFAGHHHQHHCPHPHHHHHQMVTGVIKQYAGRLRPHFIEVRQAKSILTFPTFRIWQRIRRLLHSDNVYIVMKSDNVYPTSSMWGRLASGILRRN